MRTTEYLFASSVSTAFSVACPEGINVIIYSFWIPFKRERETLFFTFAVFAKDMAFYATRSQAASKLFRN